MSSLRGTIERIVFSNPESGYAVVRLQPQSDDSATARALGPVTTVVGTMPGITEGNELELDGEWVIDKRFGRQFRVSNCSVVVPATVEGIEKYLASGAIPGIGPVMAGRIVETFGERTLEVIRSDPDALLEVPGLGKKRAEDVRTAWESQHGAQEVLIFLASHGIPTGTSARIWQAYGPRAVGIVSEDPYRLADEVRGIGFRTADTIASSVGIDRESPRRIAAGLVYTLQSGVEDGHVYLPEETLVRDAAELLGVDASLVENAVVALLMERRIVVEDAPDGHRAVYVAELHDQECELARLTSSLAKGRLTTSAGLVDAAVRSAEERLSIDLAPEQGEAVRSVLEHKLVVVTGGPGTGKTTVVRSICAALQHLGQRLILAAPTGRAAKRMSEATGLPASTIHRALGWVPRTQAFERDQDNPLPADAVIVDEASMLDLKLALALVRAVPTAARLVLVGDVDQLPPVGAGNVLPQVIASELARVVRLTVVFRQGQESLIIQNAHRVLTGEPLVSGEPGGEADFYFIRRDDPQAVIHTLRELMTSRLERAFGYDPIADVQVLSPMNRGELGTANLNIQFQEWLNPDGRGHKRGNRELREGDKVMVVRNNYDKEVFNGDLGRVERVRPDARLVSMVFDGRIIDFEYNELDDVDLAYATTVHKSQGSEYPAVVIPLHGQHYVMLQRNLLYTAITRAKRLVVVVGSERAVRLAVQRDDTGARSSLLLHRLRGDIAC